MNRKKTTSEKGYFDDDKPKWKKYYSPEKVETIRKYVIRMSCSIIMHFLSLQKGKRKCKLWVRIISLCHKQVRSFLLHLNRLKPYLYRKMFFFPFDSTFVDNVTINFLVINNITFFYTILSTLCDIFSISTRIMRVL